MLTQLSSQVILGALLMAGPGLAEDRVWGRRAGGPGRALSSHVKLRDNPSGVNLATVFGAIASADMSFLWDKRVKSPKSEGDTKVTMIVQGKENIKKEVETQVDYNNVDETYCDPDDSVWPCVLATAMQNAGWNIKSPIGVPDLLKTVTGFDPVKIYDYDLNRTSVSNTTIYENVYGPYKYGRQPYVLLTRLEGNVTKLKPNYAYNVGLQHKQNWTLLLEDMDAGGGGGHYLNYTDFIDDISQIWTTVKPLSVAGQDS